MTENNTQVQYIVPILEIDNTTEGIVMMHTRGLKSLVTHGGHLKDCEFSKYQSPSTEKYILFQAVDLKAAHDVYDALNATELPVLPVQKTEYNSKTKSFTPPLTELVLSAHSSHAASSR